MHVLYLTLIDLSLGYHNLKHDEKSSFLTTFVCQFGTYGYMRLPFGTTPAGNIFERKIDEYSKNYQMFLA